jgi:EamA-like transporter family
MTGALLAFSAMAVSIRALGASLSVMEILALRGVLGLAAMAMLAGVNPLLRAAINLRHFGLHLVRNTVHLAATYLWALSLLILPLATVFALEFTTPAWTLLLALPVLGERMTVSRVGAVVLGLIGVLVILRPGVETFRPASVLVLGAAFGNCNHVDRHEEAHPNRQFLRDHLLDESHPGAACVRRLAAALRDKAQHLADAGRRRNRMRRADFALLPGERLPGRRCDGGCATRLHANPIDSSDRMVALRREPRSVCFRRRRSDHCRGALEPAG